MNGHTSSKQVRSRLQALGFSAILAGTVLATSAASVLAMPAQPLGRATLRQEIYDSLSPVTWLASKVAAQPEAYLGIDDATSTTSAFQVPHQVAPI